MYDLITIGDTKLDSFVVLTHASLQCQIIEHEERCFLCIEHGAKIPVRDFEPQIAGSAPNVAVGIARLGLKTAIYTIVGDDATGRLAFTRFKEERVDARYVRISKRERSSFSVVITYRGDRTILAAHQPHRYRLPRLERTRWLYISELGRDFEDLFRDVIRVANGNGVRVGFNPGVLQLKAGVRKLRPMLRATEVLFVNKEEGHALTNHRANGLDLRHLITTLWKLGPKVVVLTDGKRGAYGFDGGDVWHCATFPTKVIEMTGAGDSFACAFLAARMHDKPLPECLRWGAANSASVISMIGPQPGLLTTGRMMKALRTHTDIVAKPL